MIHPINLITPQHQAQMAQLVRLTTQEWQEVAACAQKICDTPALQDAFLADYNTLYTPPFEDAPLASDAAVVDGLLGEHAPWYTFLVLMAGLPALKEIYAARGIGQDVLYDTMDNYHFFFNEHRKKFGHVGIERCITGWLAFHMRGQLFQLGRLQFQYRRCEPGVVVVRNTQSGQVVSLAASGTRYRADGLVDGTNNQFDPDAFTAPFVQTEDYIEGIALDENGPISRAVQRYPKPLWQVVSTPSSLTLAVHVPNNGQKLTPQSCCDSWRRMLAFYPKHFPEYKPALVTVVSWLLAPYWEELLPENSNVLFFRRQFNRLPQCSQASQVLYYTFGQGDITPATVPDKTSLQQAIANRHQAGLPLYATAGYVVFDAADRAFVG